MKLVKKYFSEIENQKIEKFIEFAFLLSEYNKNVNLISRKDVENIETNHILHSLAIAKFIQFEDKSKIIDIGTGAGLPGIPLSIFFDKCSFTLVDSIGKKINVVKSIIQKLDLKNVEAINCRIETLRTPKVDFIVSRAVAPINQLYNWSKHLAEIKNYNKLKNGYILLKGGDLDEEIKNYMSQTKNLKKVDVVNISNYYEEEFFETKKIIYLPF